MNTVSAMWSKWWSVINEKKYGKLVLADIVAFSLLVLSVQWFRRAAKKSWEGTRLPPGPRGLPLIGYLPFLGTDLHREFANLASVYGPIFKFWLGNKLCVVITSPSLVKEVVRDQDTTFANRDSTVSELITSYGGHDIAFRHNLYELRRDEVKKSLRHIYEKINTPVDIGNLAFLTAINAIMSMSCGDSIQGESAVIDAADFKKAAAELMRLLGKPNVSDIFPSLARFDIQGIERDTKKVNRVFEDMFDSTIEKRKKTVAEAKGKRGENNNNNRGKEMNMRKDFLQFLLELHENEDSSESSLSTAELKP
ncbi:Cytochrome P450, E-class, group I [Parasponia andersonii]|uniref:Cytochrome P450, E-class, group I n=1 Tax=Parasponia andersonii TaxID=3476 RepID=A0A2P5BYA5_PARAD|nr:Cytochrome P450, E-class, group I [Parasponia andersonii]